MVLLNRTTEQRLNLGRVGRHRRDTGKGVESIPAIHHYDLAQCASGPCYLGPNRGGRGVLIIGYHHGVDVNQLGRCEVSPRFLRGLAHRAARFSVEAQHLLLCCVQATGQNSGLCSRDLMGRTIERSNSGGRQLGLEAGPFLVVSQGPRKNGFSLEGGEVGGGVGGAAETKFPNVFSHHQYGGLATHAVGRPVNIDVEDGITQHKHSGSSQGGEGGFQIHIRTKHPAEPAVNQRFESVCRPRHDAAVRAVVIRLSSLGDVVLTEPVIRVLKAAGFDVSFVTKPHYAPWVTKNFELPVTHYEHVRDAVTIARHLGRTDVVVDLQGSLPSRTLARLIPAPQRISFTKRSPREGLQSLRGRGPVFHDRSASLMYLDALKPLRLDALDPGPLARTTPAQHRRLGVAVGGRHASKCWPVASFPELLRRLRARHPDLGVVLLGGPDDRQRVASLRAALPQLRDAEDTCDRSVVGLSDAIAQCELVVSNDSAPVHLAGVLGVPVVAVFGPTSWIRWRPRGAHDEVVRRNLDCAPCSNYGGPACPLGHHRCLQELGVDEVEAAVDRIWAKSA